MEDSLCYSIERKIIAEVANMREKAYIDAIYRWAEKNGIDEVVLCDEEKLKEVLKLGLSEYQRLHGD